MVNSNVMMDLAFQQAVGATVVRIAEMVPMKLIAQLLADLVNSVVKLENVSVKIVNVTVVLIVVMVAMKTHAVSFFLKRFTLFYFSSNFIIFKITQSKF